MKIEIPAFTPMLKANEHLAHGAFSIDLGDDVVMVVRCKDCKYYGEFGCSMFYDIQSAPEDAPTENDFCSYGKRKST